MVSDRLIQMARSLNSLVHDDRVMTQRENSTPTRLDRQPPRLMPPWRSRANVGSTSGPVAAKVIASSTPRRVAAVIPGVAESIHRRTRPRRDCDVVERLAPAAGRERLLATVGNGVFFDDLPGDGHVSGCRRRRRCGCRGPAHRLDRARGSAAPAPTPAASRATRAASFRPPVDAEG